MMVVFISLKKLNEATRAWIETRLFGSLVQIVSTTHKKIKTTPYVLLGSQEVYIMKTPLLLPPFLFHLNRFFIFPSITSHTQPPEQLKASQDLPKTTTITSAWVSRQYLHPGELSSCLHCGACRMLQDYGVNMGLNSLCNLILK